MGEPLNYYIGERRNPQLGKSYYNAYGQLTKSDAKRKEDCLYGSITTFAYEDEESYLKEIRDLRAKGFTVNER